MHEMIEQPLPLARNKPSFSLTPQSIEEAIRFADMLSKSNMVPKEYIGNPGNIIVAMQWGLEVGLQPMQAMQNIAVINGRPSMWGDSVLALVKGSPLCEYVIEEVSDAGATCTVKRAGEPEQSRSFTVADAKTAGLHGKQGPWTQYPKRMLQMRARSWALRDVFPDVLRGMAVLEEVRDMETKDITPALHQEKIEAKPEFELCTAEKFEKTQPQWRAIVEQGKKTPDELIAFLSTKLRLTDDQKMEIASWANCTPYTPE